MNPNVLLHLGKVRLLKTTHALNLLLISRMQGSCFEVSKKNNSVLNIIMRSQAHPQGSLQDVDWGGGTAGTSGIAKLFSLLIFCTEITNVAVSSPALITL